MATCTFFGHKDCSFSVAETLKKTLIPLIEEHNATEFIVGNQGNFDAMASQVTKKIYLHIRRLSITKGTTIFF